MCLNVGPFVSNLFGTLQASWSCVSFSITSLGKFSAIFSLNRLSISCWLASLVSPECGCCYASCCSKCFLSSPQFIKFVFGFFLCCSTWVYFSTLSFKPLIWYSASSNLWFIPSSILFISGITFFISDWSFFMVSMSFFHAVEYPYNYYYKLSDKLLTSILSNSSGNLVL